MNEEEQYVVSCYFSDVINEEIPTIKWTDIIGMNNVKKILQEYVILPFKFPQLFQEFYRIRQNQLLIYGPSGTGKTQLVRSCANESGASFFQINAYDLMFKYNQSGQQLIKDLFQKAKIKAPSIIFVDEIDLIGSTVSEEQEQFSNQQLTQFLIETQNLKYKDQVHVLGITNQPWNLHSSIRRRFDRRIYVGLPDIESRQKIIQTAIQETQNNLKKEEFEELAIKTEGFTGSDLINLVKFSIFEPIQRLKLITKYKQIIINEQIKWVPSKIDEDGIETTLLKLGIENVIIPDVCYDDFLINLQKMKPSISIDILKQFEDWTNQFGMDW